MAYRKPTMKNAICSYCQSPFYRNPSQPKTIHCSQACRDNAQRERGIKTWRDYPDYQRAQVTYTCLYCGKVFLGRVRKKGRKFCSILCSTKHSFEINPHRGMIRHKISSQKRTDIEAIMEKCLQENGIRYEWEKQFGRYRVDFFLPDHNVAIECDGTHWHQGKEEHDKRRDAELKERYGIQVKRFSDKQIYANVHIPFCETLAS